MDGLRTSVSTCGFKSLGVDGVEERNNGPTGEMNGYTRAVLQP